MPPKVASAGHKSLTGKFASRMHKNYKIDMSASGKGAHLDKFWTVDDKVLNLAEKLASRVPASGTELIQIAHEEGCEDMFPSLNKEEKSFLASDGKIPEYSRWEKKIKEDRIAPDTLLTLAGLASFTSDQKMLDERIMNIIS
jgi:transaldolase